MLLNFIIIFSITDKILKRAEHDILLLYMSSGETIISILLGVISYFLYQIAKQLSYLTGKRLKMRFSLPRFNLPQSISKKSAEKEKLPN